MPWAIPSRLYDREMGDKRTFFYGNGAIITGGLKAKAALSGALIQVTDGEAATGGIIGGEGVATHGVVGGKTAATRYQRDDNWEGLGVGIYLHAVASATALGDHCDPPCSCIFGIELEAFTGP